MAELCDEEVAWPGAEAPVRHIREQLSNHLAGSETARVAGTGTNVPN